MYRIIGGDQKEYGPVTAEQLRQWLAEGRLNAQTSVLPEGATDWKPLSALPEFSDVLGPTMANSTAPTVGQPMIVPPEVILARDYDLDIGDCLSRSWELVKKNFWPVVGVNLLIMLVIGGINQLLGLVSGPATRTMILERRISATGIAIVAGISILSTPVYTVLMAGLFRYYLKLIRGEEARIADAFAGFGSSAGSLALLGLVSAVLTWIGYILCVLPGIYLNVAWIFSIPLVIDRGLGFWEAMELSRRVVSKHWFIVFALLLVMGLVSISGLIACCVGIFVTMTIGSVALMYAYEDIFSRQAP